jgi:glycosyltransferase involved in cell wall biosynthesis
MKILQLHNKLPYPPKDGGSIAIWNLSKELASMQHEVTLLSMNTRKHYFPVESIPDKEKQAMQIHAVDVEAPVKAGGLISNFLFSNQPYNAVRFNDKGFRNKLIEILKNNVFDVIQLEGLYVTPYIPVIRNYSGALIAYRAHNIEHEIWSRIKANEPSYYKRKYLNILVRRLRNFEIKWINQADLVLPITTRDASELRTLGCNRPMHVCPAAVNLGEVIPQPRKTEYPSLFYIGALDWAPNQEGLVWFFDNLWSRINKEFPDIKLYIAGRNCPGWLKMIIEQPGVEFLGEIENAYDFMNRYAVMIAPLFSGSGMRVKVIEGMALGKTIITTSIGTEGIETTSNSNILIANTADEFYQHIANTLTNKSLCSTIGKNAIDFIRKQYDVKYIARELERFYKQHIK